MHATEFYRYFSDNKSGLIGQGDYCSNSCRNKIQFMLRLLGSILRTREHHLEYTGWVPKGWRPTIRSFYEHFPENPY